LTEDKDISRSQHILHTQIIAVTSAVFLSVGISLFVLKSQNFISQNTLLYGIFVLLIFNTISAFTVEWMRKRNRPLSPKEIEKM